MAMTENNRPVFVPPFPRDYRACGILLHVTSLPSPYGIGDMGPSAFNWIDLLHKAGQSWWQSLPLGPTGYGNSPYQSLSSFAGNGLLASPEALIEDGFLRLSDCEGQSFPASAIDFGAVIPFKHRLLDAAWSRFCNGARPDMRAPYEQFCDEQAHWLDDYAFFRALKLHYHGAHYLDWPAELVQRVPSALAKARRQLSSQIAKIRFAQFLLFSQAERLKNYAHSKGVRLIGDLPFFVSPDSSDVWVNPELFLLDEQQRPRFVAGVPPDYFSAQGQLWGNPVYNWETLRRTGYRWWINRFRALLAHVDAIRLDHFRAFAAAWHVPAGAATAKSGQWSSGPGPEFFVRVKRELDSLPLIAEDLGLITADVSALRDQFQLPGTRVLQFAFDGNPKNPHLPDNFTTNTVVYTGTHDNNTTRGWFESMTENERLNVSFHLSYREDDSTNVAWEFIRQACSSRAALAMIPLQDVLNLGSAARMNVPGRAEGNWIWRFAEASLSESVFEDLRNLTVASNRIAVSERTPENAALKAAS
jgi:4-alpha-glucanotransferase